MAFLIRISIDFHNWVNKQTAQDYDKRIRSGCAASEIHVVQTHEACVHALHLTELKYCFSFRSPHEDDRALEADSDYSVCVRLSHTSLPHSFFRHQSLVASFDRKPCVHILWQNSNVSAEWRLRHTALSSTAAFIQSTSVSDWDTVRRTATWNRIWLRFYVFFGFYFRFSLSLSSASPSLSFAKPNKSKLCSCAWRGTARNPTSDTQSHSGFRPPLAIDSPLMHDDHIQNHTNARF